ncbi:MAG: aldo/keto reductase [Verrucomicrobiales bacterium]|nr:aldo/keto reductase [Verrucomicrobiales bacterium]
MKRSKLAAQGPEFSRMVYGTWRLLDTQPAAQEVNRRLHACLDLGITTIDTAEIYGLSPATISLTADTRNLVAIPCHHPPSSRTDRHNPFPISDN